MNGPDCPACGGQMIDHCPGKAGCRWLRCLRCDPPVVMDPKTGNHIVAGGKERT